MRFVTFAFFKMERSIRDGIATADATGTLASQVSCYALRPENERFLPSKVCPRKLRPFTFSQSLDLRFSKSLPVAVSFGNRSFRRRDLFLVPAASHMGLITPRCRTAVVLRTTL